MSLVIVGVLSLGLGILALIGLLVVARDGSFDADPTDTRAKGRHDVGGRASGRCVTTR
jgi:hypothetical protein